MILLPVFGVTDIEEDVNKSISQAIYASTAVHSRKMKPYWLFSMGITRISKYHNCKCRVLYLLGISCGHEYHPATPECGRDVSANMSC